MTTRLSRWLFCLALVVAMILPRLALAHDLFPGFLELRASSDSTYQVLWKLPLLQGQRLPIAPRFPDDCALQGDLNSSREARALVYRAELHCQTSLADRCPANAADPTGIAHCLRVA